MENVDVMRAEIRHLKVLASLTTDAEVLAAISAMISELERRVRLAENGVPGED